MFIILFYFSCSYLDFLLVNVKQAWVTYAVAFLKLRTCLLFQLLEVKMEFLQTAAVSQLEKMFDVSSFKTLIKSKPSHYLIASAVTETVTFEPSTYPTLLFLIAQKLNVMFMLIFQTSYTLMRKRAWHNNFPRPQSLSSTSTATVNKCVSN